MIVYKGVIYIMLVQKKESGLKQIIYYVNRWLSIHACYWVQIFEQKAGDLYIKPFINKNEAAG